MDALLRFEIVDLYTAYIACLDQGRLDEWPEFFTETCNYKVIARENHDRGYNLAALSFESKGMLKDRVYSVTKSLFHAPYYQRHVISPPQLLEGDGGLIRTQVNYLVIRTRQNEPSEVFNAGRYIDTIVRENGQLKFREKLCVFDSELIPNSIIYPI